MFESVAATAVVLAPEALRLLASCGGAVKGSSIVATLPGIAVFSVLSVGVNESVDTIAGSHQENAEAQRKEHSDYLFGSETETD